MLFTSFLFSKPVMSHTSCPPHFYPGEMSLGSAPFVKLASLTERLTKKAMLRLAWDPLAVQCQAAATPLLFFPPSPFHVISILILERYQHHPTLQTSFPLYPSLSWSLSAASLSQRSLFVGFFSVDVFWRSIWHVKLSLCFRT